MKDRSVFSYLFRISTIICFLLSINVSANTLQNITTLQLHTKLFPYQSKSLEIANYNTLCDEYADISAVAAILHKDGFPKDYIELIISDLLDNLSNADRGSLQYMIELATNEKNDFFPSSALIKQIINTISNSSNYSFFEKIRKYFVNETKKEFVDNTIDRQKYFCVVNITKEKNYKPENIKQ